MYCVARSRQHFLRCNQSSSLSRVSNRPTVRNYEAFTNNLAKYAAPHKPLPVEKEYSSTEIVQKFRKEETVSWLAQMEASHNAYNLSNNTQYEHQFPSSETHKVVIGDSINFTVTITLVSSTIP